MANDFGTFSWHDYDGEPSHMSVNTVEITAANLDAQQTLLTSLRTAMNDITIAVVDRQAVTDIGWNTAAPTTDPFGQRETKWVIIVDDGNGNVYKGNEIPTADLALLENGSKYIIKNYAVSVSDPDGFVADFKTAYEAVAKTNAGGALVIKEMYQAGRNT